MESRRELHIWIGLQPLILERAGRLLEIHLILSAGLAASKLTESGIFSGVTWRRRPSSQSHEDMLIGVHCFCQLFTVVFIFRCRLSWHMELSQGCSMEMKPCFPPSSVIILWGVSGESIVTVQWMLTYSDVEQLIRVAGRLTVLFWNPSQRAGSQPPSPHKLYWEMFHELPKLWVSCESLPSLDVGRKGVWIIPLRKLSTQSFSAPIYKNEFTT